jgi:mono/diheme cytochrome c family protein
MLLMANPNNAVLSVFHGGFAPSTQANPRPYGMPPYLLQLTDADIASVLSFVRASWGNSAAPITELEVHQIRKP